MDERKSEDGDPLRKFGDFFLWKELLEHGKEQKRPIIFVTDDKKEDWWLKVKGRTLGPRPELIAEFILARCFTCICQIDFSNG